MKFSLSAKKNLGLNWKYLNVYCFHLRISLLGILTPFGRYGSAFTIKFSTASTC